MTVPRDKRAPGDRPRSRGAGGNAAKNLASQLMAFVGFAMLFDDGGEASSDDGPGESSGE